MKCFIYAPRWPLPWYPLAPALIPVGLVLVKARNINRGRLDLATYHQGVAGLNIDGNNSLVRRRLSASFCKVSYHQRQGGARQSEGLDYTAGVRIGQSSMLGVVQFGRAVLRSWQKCVVTHLSPRLVLTVATLLGNWGLERLSARVLGEPLN